MEASNIMSIFEVNVWLFSHLFIEFFATLFTYWPSLASSNQHILLLDFHFHFESGEDWQWWCKEKRAHEVIIGQFYAVNSEGITIHALQQKGCCSIARNTSIFEESRKNWIIVMLLFILWKLGCLKWCWQWSA